MKRLICVLCFCHLCIIIIFKTSFYAKRKKRPRKAYPLELSKFHSEDYINFLRRVSPDQVVEPTYNDQLCRYNLKESVDCPIFENLFDFCQIYTGASLEGALKLCHNHADVAINWAGGLHHAKKSEASGFCYVNDLVLCILEMLKYYPRVLYIDIDIHHGDGVEEAFYLTDRVMTVSFHKYGDNFFPGTGEISDVGENSGKYYSVNVPLKDGIFDDDFVRLFQQTMSKVMEVYRPGAIVLQCGADSLAHDRLGCFNLSLDGHAECVKFMKKFNIPLLLTGGGGYTKNNVSRCWCNETATVLDTKLANVLPKNDYYDYYAPYYTLRPNKPPYIENANTKAYLNTIRQQVFENLNSLIHAPSVQMQEIPPDLLIPEFDNDDLLNENMDVRFTTRDKDKEIKHEGEFYENEKDQ